MNKHRSAEKSTKKSADEDSDEEDDADTSEATDDAEATDQAEDADQAEGTEEVQEDSESAEQDSVQQRQKDRTAAFPPEAARRLAARKKRSYTAPSISAKFRSFSAVSAPIFASKYAF